MNALHRQMSQLRCAEPVLSGVEGFDMTEGATEGLAKNSQILSPYSDRTFAGGEPRLSYLGLKPLTLSPVYFSQAFSRSTSLMFANVQSQAKTSANSSSLFF